MSSDLSSTTAAVAPTLSRLMSVPVKFDETSASVGYISELTDGAGVEKIEDHGTSASDTKTGYERGVQRFRGREMKHSRDSTPEHYLNQCNSRHKLSCLLGNEMRKHGQKMRLGKDCLLY
jgi:hypothetical protein